MSELSKKFEEAVDAAKKVGKDIHNMPGQWHDIYRGSDQMVIPYEPQTHPKIVPHLSKELLDSKGKRVLQFIGII